MGTGRGVLDGVVDQIDDHLDDEPGVHIRHQQIVLQFYRDMVLLRIAVQMGQGFMKDLIQKLRTDVQRNRAVAHPGEGEQIFHQVDEPHGVIVDGAVQVAPLLLIQHGPVLHQDAGVPGYTGQWGAQVVGDGPQQIGAQGLLMGQLLDLLLGARRQLLFQRQSALVQDGYCQIFFKGVHLLSIGDGNANHRQHLVRAADRNVEAFGAGKGVGGSAGVLVVVPDPFRHRPL